MNRNPYIQNNLSAHRTLQESPAIPTLPLVGERAPSFKADSTLGPINFPEDFKGKWVVLSSYTSDFCTTCTSEFLAIIENFDKYKDLDTQLVAFNVDTVLSHQAWIENIKKFNIPNTEEVISSIPIVSDRDREIAKKYGLIRRGEKNPETVRGLFVIDPAGIIRASSQYPLEVGRDGDELRRLIEALQIADQQKVGLPANWMPGDKVIVTDPRRLEEIRKDPVKYKKQCASWFLCFDEEK